MYDSEDEEEDDEMVVEDLEAEEDYEPVVTPKPQWEKAAPNRRQVYTEEEVIQEQREELQAGAEMEAEEYAQMEAGFAGAEAFLQHGFMEKKKGSKMDLLGGFDAVNAFAGFGGFDMSKQNFGDLDGSEQNLPNSGNEQENNETSFGAEDLRDRYGSYDYTGLVEENEAYEDKEMIKNHGEENGQESYDYGKGEDGDDAHQDSADDGLLVDQTWKKIYQEKKHDGEYYGDHLMKEGESASGKTSLGSRFGDELISGITPRSDGPRYGEELMNLKYQGKEKNKEKNTQNKRIK